MKRKMFICSNDDALNLKVNRPMSGQAFIYLKDGLTVKVIDAINGDGTESIKRRRCDEDDMNRC